MALRDLMYAPVQHQAAAQDAAGHVDTGHGVNTFLVACLDGLDVVQGWLCNWQWQDNGVRTAFRQRLISPPTPVGITDNAVDPLNDTVEMWSYADPDPATEPTKQQDLLAAHGLHLDNPEP